MEAQTATSSSPPQSGTCHFVISGEWLTHHVRERVQSDMEDSALALLVDDLDGMTYEIAIDILRGRKRLIGNSGTEEGVTLADEEPEARAAWEAILRWRYANRCEMRLPDGSGRRGWFRPVAYIIDFGPMDVREGPVYGNANTSKTRRYKTAWLANRLWHYALDGEVALSPTIDLQDSYPGVDRVKAFGREGIPGLDGPCGGLGFLFEPTSAVPIWVRDIVAKTPTEALRAHVPAASLYLEERGHSIWYPDEAEKNGRFLRGMLATAEENTAKDTRSSPAVRTAAAKAGVNLRAAEAARDAARDSRTRASARTEAENLDVTHDQKAGDTERAAAAAAVVVDRRREREQEAEANEAEREAECRAHTARLAAEIRERAGPIDGPGWFTMTIMPHCPAEFTVRVPLAPFTCWSLWRTSGRHLMPKYTPTCESGMRLFGDDAYHSDWMLGAFPDRNVSHTYQDTEVRDASFRAQGEVQARMLGFTASVLSGRGVAEGHAVHPNPGDILTKKDIVILPNARPEWESVVRTAGATIVPVGGELCHLAVCATESGRIILRVEDCMTKYPRKTPLHVNAERGRVTIADYDVRNAFGPIERE